MKVVVTMGSSNKRMDHGSVKNVDHTDEECEHYWVEIGTLIFYEKGAPVMPTLNGCYSGHIKTDKQISVFKCKKCREVKFQWNPWRTIIEGEKDV